MIVQSSIPARPYRSPMPARVPAAGESLQAPRDQVEVGPVRLSQVALLPVFDPAVGSVLVMSALALGMAGGQVGAVMQPTLTGHLGNHGVQIRYSLSQNGMTSVGTLQPWGGGEPDQGASNVSERLVESGEKSARLVGQVGDDREDVTITPGADGIRVVGTVGTTPVDLTYGLQGLGSVACGEGEFPWASVHGTVGNAPYHAAATILTPSEAGDLAIIHVQGSLGGEGITKTYRVTADPQTETLTIDGHGTLAGLQQDMRLVVDLTQARPGGALLQGMLSAR